MKSLRFPVAALFVLGSALPLLAQVPQAANQQLPAQPQQLPARQVLSPTTPQKPLPNQHRVSRPPEETRASVKTRISTAQAGAARATVAPLTTLPAFTATALDGHTLPITSAAHIGHWLLVYRRGDCVPCDQTLLALAGSANPDLRGGLAYTIVVGDASASNLASLKAKFNTLGNATWLLDSNREALTALKPRGAPMLYALNGDHIEWTAVGNLGNPALVEQRAAAWLAVPADNTTGPAPVRVTVAK